MKEYLELRINPNMAWRRLDFYLVNVRPDSTVSHVAKPVTMSEIIDDGIDVEPTFSLSPEAAQLMMDALWAHGIRPHDADSPGRVEAMQAHLNDLRRLVFDRECNND